MPTFSTLLTLCIVIQLDVSHGFTAKLVEQPLDRINSAVKKDSVQIARFRKVKTPDSIDYLSSADTTKRFSEQEATLDTEGREPSVGQAVDQRDTSWHRSELSLPLIIGLSTLVPAILCIALAFSLCTKLFCRYLPSGSDARCPEIHARNRVLSSTRANRVYRALFDNNVLAAVKRLEVTGEGAFSVFQNGSLEDQLHGCFGCNLEDMQLQHYSSDARMSMVASYDAGGANGAALSWNMQLKIVLDAARGLEYLHEYCVPPVAHRAFKSSNILLDAYFNAKVSDFGLTTAHEEVPH